jgi:hypothetical protein
VIASSVETSISGHGTVSPGAGRASCGRQAIHAIAMGDDVGDGATVDREGEDLAGLDGSDQVCRVVAKLSHRHLASHRC